MGNTGSSPSPADLVEDGVDDELTENLVTHHDGNVESEDLRSRLLGAAPFLSDIFSTDFRPSLLEEDRVIRHLPPIHPTHTISCPFELKKSSLELIPIGLEDAIGGGGGSEHPPPEDVEAQDSAHTSATIENPSEPLEPSNDEESHPPPPPPTPPPVMQYDFHFALDTNVPCLIHVLLGATGTRDITTKDFELLSPLKTIRCSPGISLSHSFPVDFSSIPEEQLLQQRGPDEVDEDEEDASSTEYWPLVVVIQPDHHHPSDLPPTTVAEQVCYIKLFKSSINGAYIPRVARVSVDICGTQYIVHDIYGLEAEEDGLECVICITEPRDTIVLPCGHLCLCRACAEVLRCQSNRCPICRARFHSLIKIDDPHDQEGGDV